MSETPNLDAAIAASGQKVPFKPVFTLDDLRRDETRAQALIELIKTPKEVALEVLDGVEALAAVAVPIAFPQVAPFVGVGLKALDKIEEIIRRGRIEPTEDATALLELYAEFNGVRDSLPKPPGDDATEEPPAAPATGAGGTAAARHGGGHGSVPTGHQDTSGGQHDTSGGGGGGHHDAHGNPVNADGSPVHGAAKKKKG